MKTFRSHRSLFYPLVFAVYPVVFFWAENQNEGILLTEVLTIIGIALAATIILTGILKFWIKDDTRLSAVVIVAIGVVFLYGAAHTIFVDKLKISISGVTLGEHWHLLPVATVFTLTVICWIVSTRRKLTLLLNAGVLIVAFLIVVNVGKIALTDLHSSSEPIRDELPGTIALAAQDNVNQLPDVYYIVLDSYGRTDTLQENLGFDNSDFVGMLTERGFFIGTESRSNYILTQWSLSSSLNMRYVAAGESPEKLIKDNSVTRIFQDAGYEYVHFGSGWFLTKDNPNADVTFLGQNSLPLLTNEFSHALLRRTVMGPILDALGANLDSPYTADQANRFTYNMENLKSIPYRAGPTFVFNHNIPPHSPFVFDRNGNLQTQGKPVLVEDNELGGANYYIEQVLWVNRNMVDLVDNILENSETEPIIIIHGDHGPQRFGRYLEGVKSEQNRQLMEQTAILNALYLPEYCRSGLYPTISPVNAFRFVFDSCFGADIGLIEDRAFPEPGDPPVDFNQLKLDIAAATEEQEN